MVDFYCFLYFWWKEVNAKTKVPHTNTNIYVQIYKNIQKCVLFIHACTYRNQNLNNKIRSGVAKTNIGVIYKCAMHKRWKIPFKVFSTSKHNESNDNLRWIYVNLFRWRSHTHKFSIFKVWEKKATNVNTNRNTNWFKYFVESFVWLYLLNWVSEWER